MKLKAQIMDAAAVGRCMTRISYEIVERFFHLELLDKLR